MKTGDSFPDGQGHTWLVGEMLGRGLWGSSWLVRDGARELVLKLSHGPADLPGETPPPAGMIEACRAAAREQGDLLQREAWPFLPRLEARVEVEGRPGLILARYPSSVRRRLSGGFSVSEALQISLRVTSILEEIKREHGDLRPSNIFLNERNEPILADWITPALFAWRARLAERLPDREENLPREAVSSEGKPRGTWDTWALGLVLYRAALLSGPSLPAGARETRREERMALPHDGLDKVELSALKDRVLSRLKDDRSNPRFAPRLADRFSALLNRALSRDHEPSPPYRFVSAAELRPRLEEVAEMLSPQVEKVGTLILSSVAKNSVFTGSDPAAFSVTIECSAGVTGYEDVACGLQIVDLDEGGESRVPVPDTKYTVKTHPSGRFRFDFAIPDLPPGRYRANVAFAIKDSTQEPPVATGDFEVRPPPGYVPPPDAQPAAPVPLTLPNRPSPVRVVEDPSDPGSDPGRSPANSFPLPVPPVTQVAPLPDPVLVEVEIEIEPTVGPEAVPDTPPPPLQVAPPSIRPVPRPMPVPVPTPMPAPIAAPETPTRPSDPRPSDPGPVTDPQTGPSWSRPVDWDDTGADGPAYVPGPSGAEDLPSWNDRSTASGRSPAAAWMERLIDLARRDTYTVVMIAIGAALALLLVVFMVINAISS